MAERKHIHDLRRGGPAYEEDYAAWLAGQIALMRAGEWGRLDTEHLIDEVADLGKSDFKGFVSAIEQVLVHMLKWDIQPEKRGHSWQASIVEHRRRIVRELANSPSYKARLADAVEATFDTAVPIAARQTNMAISAYPETNPYSWDDIVSRPHFLDNTRH